MNIILDINKTLGKVFEAKGYDKSLAFCTYSDKPELSDFQCNASFQIAKVLKKNPLEIAEELANLLNIENDSFEYSFVKPAFINIKLKNETVLKCLKVLDEDERLGIEKVNGSPVILDFCSPNVAKPLHVGHLRGAVLGEAIKRISNFMGQKIFGESHFGDWGLPMGLVITALIEKGIETKDITNDLLNTIYPQASKRAKEDEEFNSRAVEITKLLQAKKQPYYGIWQHMREVSIKDILGLLSVLNANFDFLKGESFAEPYLEKAEKILKEKGLLEESQGALIVEVKEETDKEPMPPVRIRDAAGRFTYHATDIATVLRRHEENNVRNMLYITDFRQNLHFMQLFRVLKKANIVNESDELMHIGFGTVNGADGKPFKTRSGDAAKLEDLVEMVTQSVKTKMKESGRETDEAEKIGVAAIKFADLSNSPQKDYIFDMEKFCSFEGRTGPYILYTIVRIKSILKKLGAQPKLADIKMEGSLRSVALGVFKFADDFREAYKTKTPSFIASSIYNISASVNAFYNDTHILNEKDESLKLAYAKVLEVAAKALELGCEVLGIEVPEKM